MSTPSRGLSPGKTRNCPHCKAAILESLTVCPGCLHHLRFDAEAAKRQVAAQPALRVEGTIRHPPLEEPWEYYVVIAVRNERGEEVTRQVVNVGALQGSEKRSFALSVEVLPSFASLPKAPAPGADTLRNRILTGVAAAPAATPASTGARPAAGSPPAPGASATAPAGKQGPGTAAPTAGAAAGPAANTHPAQPARPSSGYVLKPPVPGAPRPPRKP